jgi:hypothetical protein
MGKEDIIPIILIIIIGAFLAFFFTFDLVLLLFIIVFTLVSFFMEELVKVFRILKRDKTRVLWDFGKKRKIYKYK